MEELKVIEAFRTLNAVRDVEAGAGSQGKKLSILEAGDTPELRRVLMVALDPFVRTNIKKIELQDDLAVSDDDFDGLVMDITTRKALTNELRDRVRDYVTMLPSDVQETAIQVLTKDLNIGVGPKSINKALGVDLINTRELMKAASDISIVEKWISSKERVFAEIKYDGVRGFACINLDGTVESIQTYNMRYLQLDLIPWLVSEIEDFARCIHTKSPVFLDFEILSADRQSVSGDVNRVLQGTAPVGIDKENNWYISVFDWNYQSALLGGHSNQMPYTVRRSQLMGWLQAWNTFSNDVHSFVRGAKVWEIRDMQMLDTLFEAMLKNGEEGLVVKNGSGLYEFKRSKNWVKMKAERECDLRVTGFTEGTGKREIYFGAMQCESADGKLQVDVGSGFSDELLDTLSVTGMHTHVGKIAKIKYNSRIKRKNSATESLFLPRFVSFRYDKDEADTIDQIKK